MVSIQTSCLIIFLSLFKQPSHQATLLAPEDHEMSIKHKNWMIQNKRNYVSEEETERRFKIFKDNVEYIENFNRDKSHTYGLGINEFADLTKEEFHSKYTRSSMPSYRRFSVSTNFRYENVRRVPCSLDWRELGAVTPVKNQGNCGSCWVFSAVATIEGISWIRSCVLESLSEQHIIDCDGASDGCKGGSIEHAFEFVKRNKGLSSDKDYPYQKKEGTCKSDKPSSLAAKITGYERVPANNETAMLRAVANQPVSVQLDASLFQFYKSGVLTGECGTNITHAVTAVGYGTSEDGIKYWLLKNSWGSKWGEDGYIRLERDVDEVVGMCGLAMILTYPTA